MRDNRFNGTGGGMNGRIGCVPFISVFSGIPFHIFGCNSFDIWTIGILSELSLV